MQRTVTSLLVALCCSVAWAGAFPGGAAYVAAHDAENAGKYADAIARYENCAKLDPALADFARVRAVACRGRGGDTNGAVHQLRAFVDGPNDSAFALLARAELAALLHGEGQHAEAVRLLQPIIDAPISPKWLGPYERLYGDSLIALSGPASRAKGFAAFAKMLSESRTRAQRLEAANRLANSPDPRQRLDAANVYVNAGEWGSADSTLTALEASLGTARQKYEVEIDYLRARIRLATDTNRDAGRTALLAVAKSHSDTEAGRLALMYAARSYFSAGEGPREARKKEPAEAVKQRQTYCETASRLFDLMAGQLPDTKETGDALWWLANQHLDRDDKPEEAGLALAEFQRLAKVCPAHDRAADALFRGSVILRGKGDAQSAFALLCQIVNTYAASGCAPAAAYHCGRIYLAQDDRVHAAEMFAKAVAAGGIGSFYAHRANQRLAELDEKNAGPSDAIRAPGISGYLRPIAVDPDVTSHAKLKDAWLDRLRFFAAHGYEEAEWEVLANAKAVLESKHASAYLAAISEAGLAATADHIIEHTRWGLKDDRPTAEALPALYPRAYWSAVQTTARETGADPMLLLAIARQESLFQAHVESPAGATGVMQLMPSTAAWLAKTDTAVGAEHLQTLDTPESSFRLGGYYYRYILGKQGGNTVFAIASYNAGPGNVSKWRARLDTTDLDDFIEAIPFDETRDFVKKVLGNYAAYHSIYPDPKRLADNDYVKSPPRVAR